jgi:hypothetical protein
MTLFTVFAVFLTLVLLMGASSFRNVSAGADERFTERTPLLYISQKIRGFDRADSVRIDRLDEIDVMILSERDYDTYIYVYEGYLTELITFSDSVPHFRLGTALFAAETAEFEFAADSLVKVTIDGKSVYVGLTAGGNS